MTFYTDIRDNDAAPLIAEFGQPAVYRVYAAASYNTATGKTTKGAATDTAIQLLDLPVGGGTMGIQDDREFSQEVLTRASARFLASAAEFAAAGVVPTVDSLIVMSSKTYKILAIMPVALGGVAVIYKFAVQNV